MRTVRAGKARRERACMADADSQPRPQGEHSGGHPILGASSNSYPDGRYFATVQENPDGRSFEITHNIENAPLISRLIDRGYAIYSCTVAQFACAHRSIHSSRDACQSIALDRAELGGPPLVTPTVLLTEPCKIVIDSDRDGVHPEWSGRRVELARGARLAQGDGMLLEVSIADLISFYEYEQFEDEHGPIKANQISVACETNPFSFLIGINSELHRQMRVGANFNLSLTMTKFSSACLGVLSRRQLAADSGLGRKYLGNLKSFAKHLESNGFGHWKDKDFSPDGAAEAMFPLPETTGKDHYPGAVRTIKSLLRKRTELNESVYERYRGMLLGTKGGAEQRYFLHDVLDDQCFLEEISEIGETGLVGTGTYRFQMTEREYADPPPGIAKGLYETWKALTPATACRPPFWAYVTIMHIEAGIIRASYLASAAGDAMSGARRIKAALADRGEKHGKRVDDCVRTVLRQLGGMPGVRGSKSVHVDCPLARAWWRERFAREAANGNAPTEESIRSLLHLSPDYWEVIIRHITCRNVPFRSASADSAFASSDVRNAFLRALAQFASENRSTDLATPKGLRRLFRRVSECQEARELSCLEVGELDDIMHEIVSAA